MGLVSFIKEAGEMLFGSKEAKAGEPAAPAAAAAKPTPQDVLALSKTAGDAIATYVKSQGLKVDGLAVEFDAATGNVTVSGSVANQATREKVLLCCGNVQHVAAVNDKLTVLKAEAESHWHTVAPGDTLSKISKKFYGDPNKYPAIFEANKPMLRDPDKIYPGQVLRIPPAA